MSKALNYLGLARKAGLLELGEENTGTAVRAGKARLVMLAVDASDNARRRAAGFVHGTKTAMITVPFTKEEISGETGKAGCSMAAFVDIGFAVSFVQTLCADGPELAPVLEELTEEKQRADKRRQEAKAHEKNKKYGKRRKRV